MWKGKKKNFLILLEIFFSFMVLFATSTIVIQTLSNYWRPKGFNQESVYVLNMESHGETGLSAWEKVKSVKNLLRTMPEVEVASLSGRNFPYSGYVHSSEYDSEHSTDHLANVFTVEPSYYDVFEMDLIAGRWFKSEDVVQSNAPVVINEKLSEKLFPDGDAIGKIISSGGTSYRVQGIVKGFSRWGEFGSEEGAVFNLHNASDTAAALPTLIFKVKSGASPQWQQALLEQAGAVTGTWTFELSTVEEARTLFKRIKMSLVIAPAIVCVFLMINVAMGLFGVLWQNISKRYAEIGIRRAVGATQADIRIQIVGEMLAMSTLALFMGLLLAIQFPLLGVFEVSNHIYALGIGSSLFIIYLLVAFCALYPSIQASRIEPATALHYE